MRTILLTLIVMLTISTRGLAQLSGPLSGVIGPGTYTIQGDIYVETNDSLVIAPGTVFLFEDEYRFDIYGYIQAVGTDVDSIKFMPSITSVHWRGIDFNDSADDSSRLEYCLIRGAEPSWIYPYNNGGGILCTQCSPTICHCTITGNSVSGPWSNGAGICCYTYSSPLIENCDISRNSSDFGNGGCGGGIYCNNNCNPIIRNCLISYNAADMAGGGICVDWYCDATIENCTIYGNSGYYGGGINCGADSNPIISNCIIWGNVAPFGSQIDPCSPPIVSYCDIQDGFPGIGNIDLDPLFVSGYLGDFFLSQIAAGQMFQSPCVNAGNPASAIISGTTRTDGVQDEDTVDIGFHYPCFTIPTSLSVTLTPENPPIVIPAIGGSFNFNAQVANPGATPTGFDAWIVAGLPTGGSVNVIVRTGLNLSGGASISRDLTQTVPGSAPAGQYTYTLKAGIYPSVVWDEDGFTFEKLAGDGSGSIFDDWCCAGWEETAEVASALPDQYQLHQNYPNPFNPATTIRFDLPEASFVNLVVYDVSGRRVAELVDGWRQAGSHDVTFNASHLASGVYVYRLTAGDFSASGKMVMMK